MPEKNEPQMRAALKEAVQNAITFDMNKVLPILTKAMENRREVAKAIESPRGDDPQQLFQLYDYYNNQIKKILCLM